MGETKYPDSLLATYILETGSDDLEFKEFKDELERMHMRIDQEVSDLSCSHTMCKGLVSLIISRSLGSWSL
jgi:hypothetical protein